LELFNYIDDTFIDKIMDARKGTHGICKSKCSGGRILFWTSDPKKLTKRLNILLAEKAAGKNNVVEEV